MNKRLSIELFQEVNLLKDQVACLQSRLNDVDFIARVAAKRIAQCIGSILLSFFYIFLPH